MTNKHDSILDEAKEITGGERMKMYGHPRKNFKDTSRLWTGFLQNKLSAIEAKHGALFNLSADDWIELRKLFELMGKDVALMMVLFKISREQAGYKRDNLVDMAGYTRNIAQIEGLE